MKITLPCYPLHLKKAKKKYFYPVCILQTAFMKQLEEINVYCNETKAELTVMIRNAPCLLQLEKQTTSRILNSFIVMLLMLFW